MSSAGEDQLLARCRRGDTVAWDELFDRHYAACGRFLFQLSSSFSAGDVEEITQETFLTVIKSLNTFQGNSQFQTWLFRIAVNKARDFQEKHRAAKRGGGQLPLSLQMEDPETGLTIDPPSHAPAPDVQLARQEDASFITASLVQLGDPCREIIELRYFGDLSYEEISKALDLNEKTVSSRLSKCLDKLENIARSKISGENSPVSPSNT